MTVTISRIETNFLFCFPRCGSKTKELNFDNRVRDRQSKRNLKSENPHLPPDSSCKTTPSPTHSPSSSPLAFHQAPHQPRQFPSYNGPMPNWCSEQSMTGSVRDAATPIPTHKRYQQYHESLGTSLYATHRRRRHHCITTRPRITRTCRTMVNMNSNMAMNGNMPNIQHYLWLEKYKNYLTH